MTTLQLWNMIDDFRICVQQSNRGHYVQKFTLDVASSFFISVATSEYSFARKGAVTRFSREIQISSLLNPRDRKNRDRNIDLRLIRVTYFRLPEIRRIDLSNCTIVINRSTLLHYEFRNSCFRRFAFGAKCLP